MATRLKVSFVTLSLVILATSCKFTEPELVNLQDVKVTKFTKDAVELTVKAKITNPNNYQVSLVDSKLDVFLNDEPMGKATLKNKVHFKRNSTDIYVIQLVNKPENFAKLGIVSLFSMFGKKKMKLTVRGDVKGRVGLVSKKIPVDFTENISF